MADNFRNKQWFKNMPQERKDKICKQFDIDEKTLRKCGRETDDGRIVIDILRIDHLNTIPELWEECSKKINIHIDNIDIDDIETMVSLMQDTYICMHPDVKFLKYKSSLKNDLFVKQSYKNFIHWYNESKSIDDITSDDFKYCCYQMYSHCRCLLESDLNIVKSN